MKICLKKWFECAAPFNPSTNNGNEGLNIKDSYTLREQLLLNITKNLSRHHTLVKKKGNKN